MIVLLLFYGIFAFIGVAAAALIFWSLRRRGVGRALLGSGLALALLALFFPIPVHGGFTFPVEIILHELRSERRRVDQQETNEGKEAFRKKLAARFGGPLALPFRQDAAELLYPVVTAGGTRGFFDARSGLAWTDMLPLQPTGAPPDLAGAKAFCGQIEPKGSWALPTEAELSLFWKAGGYRLSPLADYGTAGLLENVDYQTELLSVRVSKAGAYALRCVALGPGAPAGGYLSGDIPSDEWNEYQLRKTMPGFPGPEKP